MRWMAHGGQLLLLALFMAPASALRAGVSRGSESWKLPGKILDWFAEMALEEGSDVRELVVGPLKTCKVSGVELLHGCLPPQPPVLSQGMVTKLDNEVKKMGEEVGEDYLKAQGVPEHECVVHCGLILHFETEFSCPEPAIYIEHNADVLWYTLDDRPERKKTQMWEIVSSPANDIRGLQDADYNRKEIRKRFQFPRRMTVFDLMFEMYRRDPHVQDYDAIEHNCCQWTDMMLEMLLPPGQLEEVQRKHRQDFTVIEQATVRLFGETLSKAALSLIKFGASRSHRNSEERLFQDVPKRWFRPCGGRQRRRHGRNKRGYRHCLPLRPSEEKQADREKLNAKMKAVPLENSVSDEEANRLLEEDKDVLETTLKDMEKPDGFWTLRMEAIEDCRGSGGCPPALES